MGLNDKYMKTLKLSDIVYVVNRNDSTKYRILKARIVGICGFVDKHKEYLISVDGIRRMYTYKREDLYTKEEGVKAVYKAEIKDSTQWIECLKRSIINNQEEIKEKELRLEIETKRMERFTKKLNK